MIPRFHTAVLLAALVTGGFAQPAAAAAEGALAVPPGGFYGGISVRQDGAEQGLSFGDVRSSHGRYAAFESDASGSTASAFGGYRFRNDLALEASVATVTGYRLTGRGGVGLMLPAASQPEAQAWNVDVVGSWSFWRSLSLYGRLGYAQSELAPVYRTAIAANDRQTAEGLQYGVGLRYDFSRALGLKLEYARVGSHAGEVDRSGLPDVDRLQFGVQFRF